VTAPGDTEAAATVVGRLNDLLSDFDQLSAELRMPATSCTAVNGSPAAASDRIIQGKGATGNWLPASSPGYNAVDADAGHASEKVILVIASAKRVAGVPLDTTSGPALIEDRRAAMRWGVSA
jgi:hypothetical protein